jgi:hypothetical protein
LSEILVGPTGVCGLEVDSWNMKDGRSTAATVLGRACQDTQRVLFYGVSECMLAMGFMRNAKGCNGAEWSDMPFLLASMLLQHRRN